VDSVHRRLLAMPTTLQQIGRDASGVVTSSTMPGGKSMDTDADVAGSDAFDTTAVPGDKPVDTDAGSPLADEKK
jgi:hypothetical protein